MGSFNINIDKFGEEYLLINWPSKIDPSISDELLQFEKLILNNFPDEIIESNPAYASLCIRFDWERISFYDLKKTLTVTYQSFNRMESLERSSWTIPVCYHADLAPDLLAFCKQKNISIAELVQLHSSPNYRVYFIGFLPGFLYLGGLDPRLNFPRLASPRQSVPKGAIGIAGNQTGMYPQQSPGGWNLIGRSASELFQKECIPPMSINAGDEVKFKEISIKEFEILDQQFIQRPISSNIKINPAKPKITFIKPGLFSSLQDLGRKGYRNLAIPNGGALDIHSAKKANLLLDNALDTPVLECTQFGPILSFSADCQVSITGAEVAMKLNDSYVYQKSVINISAGDTLDLQRFTLGNRLYLAIKYGFEVDLTFGSCSKIHGLASKTRFEKNDEINYNSFIEKSSSNSKLKTATSLIATEVQVSPGPEYNLLSETQIERLRKNSFSILPTATRMAFPLDGYSNNLKNEFSIITCPVIPGTVQLTPGGKLIVLMRDAQTTGGYPRILSLTEESINELAQLKIGQKFKFNVI